MRMHERLEQSKSLRENKAKREEARNSKIQAMVEQKQKFVNEYYDLLDNRETKERAHGKIMNEARDANFATCLKAIYVTAMQPETLTDNGLAIAENMVDSYIKENGGAQNILLRDKNKSYLLARIQKIVEDTSEVDVKEVEDIADDVESDTNETPSDTPAEEPKNPDEESEDLVAKLNSLGYDVTIKKVSTVKDVQNNPDGSQTTEATPDVPQAEVSDTASVDNLPTDNNTEEAEATPEEPSTEEIPTEEPVAEEPTEEEPVETPEEEPTAEVDVDDEALAAAQGNGEDNSTEEEAPEEPAGAEEVESDDDLPDDIEEEPENPEDNEIGSINHEEDKNGNMFDELDQEEDVQKAIEVIRTRVADAEEAFIKKNEEDKKKIENLLGKISDNVKTVEAIANEDNPESKVAQESAILYKRAINDITENRPQSVYEKFVRKLSESVVKDESIRESYTEENGHLDMYAINEAAKVMYGFLETLNTLKLEKVDAAYITKILNEL